MNIEMLNKIYSRAGEILDGCDSPVAAAWNAEKTMRTEIDVRLRSAFLSGLLSALGATDYNTGSEEAIAFGAQPVISAYSGYTILTDENDLIAAEQRMTDCRNAANHFVEMAGAV